MNRQRLILPISIILGCIILGVFYYAGQTSKQNLIEGQRVIRLEQEKIVEELKIEQEKKDMVIESLQNNSEMVDLYYNNRTEELYLIFSNDKPNIHTCVWTIWGDHGSEVVLVTNSTFVDKESDSVIRQNNFLPPRTSIYVTCVDWNNKSYSGFIYK